MVLGDKSAFERDPVVPGAEEGPGSGCIDLEWAPKPKGNAPFPSSSPEPLRFGLGGNLGDANLDDNLGVKE